MEGVEEDGVVQQAAPQELFTSRLSFALSIRVKCRLYEYRQDFFENIF